MKLFLTSSGLSDTNEKDFLALLGRSSDSLKVAFIPTAINPEPEEVKQKYIPKDIESLEKLGMKVEFVDLENLSEENIVETFRPFDVIYVYGGNTFYLMHWANQSGFKKYIQEIMKDKIYVGVIAGSIIACPDISLAQWGKDSDRNIVGLTDMSGLALVSFCIIPHWKGQNFTEANGYPYEVKYIKDGETLSV